MSRVIHFEIHAHNTERAMKFYTDMFSWQFQKWDGPMPYWLVTTGPSEEPGINGGLMQRMGPPPTEGQPVNAYVCTVNVANLDASMSTLLKVGGKVALAKMPIPGVGWLAYGVDTEGNIFGMMQSDPTVK